MQHADELLYPDDVVMDLPLYGNQWIPLGIPATLKERTKICAAFDGYCNGGSIMHCNVDAPFDSFEKAWKMLNWIADQGVTYFAFNSKLAQCQHNHTFYGDTCPICGEHKVREFTRTVGFYTCIETWSPPRMKEFPMRQWMPLNKNEEDA